MTRANIKTNRWRRKLYTTSDVNLSFCNGIVTIHRGKAAKRLSNFWFKDYKNIRPYVLNTAILFSLETKIGTCRHWTSSHFSIIIK
jgi:hypothetical protein